MANAAQTNQLEYWDEVSERSAWDDLYLSRRSFTDDKDRMPGAWEIRSGECARKLDHKKSKDMDGANLHDPGATPGKFTAVGRMVDAEDWEALQRVLPLINPRKNGGVKMPMSVYHPAIAVLGIHTVYVVRVTAPKIEHGILEITIDMVEWSEPKPTNVQKPADPPADDSASRQKALEEQASRELLRRGQIASVRLKGMDEASLREYRDEIDRINKEFAPPSTFDQTPSIVPWRPDATDAAGNKPSAFSGGYFDANGFHTADGTVVQ